MRRTVLSLALAAVAVAASLPAAPASADTRGCSGSFSGPVSCTFHLQAGDAGARLIFTIDLTSDPIAGRVVCCSFVNPVTGEQVRDSSGEPMWFSGSVCATSPGGTCETSAERAPVPVVTDDVVQCDLAWSDGATISGTWSCVPE